MQELAAL